MEVAHDREMRCSTFRRQTLRGFRKGNNVTICRPYKNHCVLYTQRKSLVPISDETGYATKDATAAHHIPRPCGYALCYYGGLFHFRHPWPIIDLREMSASPNSCYSPNRIRLAQRCIIQSSFISMSLGRRGSPLRIVSSLELLRTCVTDVCI